MARRMKLILAAMAALTALLVAIFLLVRAGPSPHEGAGSHHAGEMHGTPRAADEPSSLQETVPTGPPPDATTSAVAGPSLPDETPPSSGEVVSVPRKSVTRAEGERKLAGLLGLKPADKTPATELLRSHSTEELALLARVQRTTKRPPPKEVLDVIAMRRKGASYEELVRKVDRALSGNLLARVAVRKWLEQHCRPVARPDAGAPAVEAPRVRGRLQEAEPEDEEQQDGPPEPTEF